MPPVALKKGGGGIHEVCFWFGFPNLFSSCLIRFHFLFSYLFLSLRLDQKVQGSQIHICKSTPVSPPSGPATGLFNGPHRKSKFLAFL